MSRQLVSCRWLQATQGYYCVKKNLKICRMIIIVCYFYRLYDDVEPTLRRYHSLNIRIVLFSCIELELCRLCMTCTNFGDLSSFIDCYYDEEDNQTARIETKTFDRIASLQKCVKSEMLFICEHGQNVRIAHNSGVPSVIIIRSKAKHIRTYYRLRFPATNSLNSIEFVKV